MTTSPSRQIAIQVVTDLKQTVAQFREMQRLLGEQKKALLDAQAATGSAARTWKNAQADADTLRVQLALGKKELDAQAQATGKTSIEYLSLKQALKLLEADLRQADLAAKSTAATFEKQRSATRALADETSRQSQVRETARRALIAEGVDVAKLGNEYKRLAQEQAARQAVVSARSSLGIRGSTEIAAEIKQAKAAYAELAASGQASMRELARAQQAVADKVKQLKAELRGNVATPIADARATLGVRSGADIEADIAKIKSAYQTLATSGRASLGELARAKTAMRQQIRDLEAETMGWGRALDQAKAKLLGLGLAGAVGVHFGGQGAGDLAEFEKQIALVSTTTDKVPSQLKPLGQEIRQLSQDLGVSAKGAAEAAYKISGSGVALENVLPVLRQAIQAGIAGNTDTKTAADAGLNVMNAYGYGIEHLGRIYDVLFRGIADGKAEFGDLARQLGDILPIAYSSGVSLEEVSAALARMTLKGQPVPIAVTALKTALLALASPTAEAKKQADAFGITWNGLVGTLQQISDKKLGLQQLMLVLGDRDAANAVLSLTQGMGLFREELDKVKNSQGAFLAAFGKLDGIDDAKIRRFNAAFEEFKLVVGEAVLSATPLLEALTRLLRAYNDLPGPIQAVIGATTLAGGTWLVFGRTLRTVGELMTLLRANLATTATQATATGAAVAAAGTRVGTFRLALSALPAALGWVGAALSLAALGWEMFGKKADEAADRTESAIDRLKRGNADLAQAGSQSPEGLAKAAEAEIAALEQRRDALNRDIAAARAKGDAANPADLIGLVTELDNVERRIAEGREALAKQQSLTAPLPAPKPTGQGGTAPAPPERGKASPYDAQFAAAEAKNNLPPGLLKAISDVESDFNPKAENSSGAKGLMGLIPDTAHRYGVADATDPAQSIEGAGRYVAALLKEMGGDVLKTIAAYNSLTAYKQARAGTFDFASLPTETRKYVGDVSDKLKDYGNLRIDTQAMEDQAKEKKKAAEDAKKLAEESAQFQGQQARAAAEAENRADQTVQAQVEADYQARKLTVEEYYRKVDNLQAVASRRTLDALGTELAAERGVQAGRTAGTDEYVKGQQRILALEGQIAQAVDGAALATRRNQLALAQAQEQQRRSLGDPLAQIKLQMLEYDVPGRTKLADIVIPPEQQAIVAQRIQVLRNQYRDLLEQLRQAGDTQGVGQVEQFIKAQAIQDFGAKMDQATEFGIQAARNIQSSFAEFLFDPFKGGVKGMGLAFLEQLRRMAAEAASAQLMKGLLGENFEKGQIGGLLGGLFGAGEAKRPFKSGPLVTDAMVALPAPRDAPYYQGAVPDAMQMGPPAPVGSTVVDGKTLVPEDTWGDVLGSFKTGFVQIFSGDFFTGLDNIFKNGFGGIVSGIVGLFGSLSGGGGGGGSGGNSAARDASTALGLAGSVLGLFGGFGGGVNAAAEAGATNGIHAVNVSGADLGTPAALTMQFHTGGVVGQGGEPRTAPQLAFAAAPRYHGGGIAGLKADEVAAVLRKGEEVVTANDPRHRDNLGRPARPSVGGDPANFSVKNINVLDASLLGEHLNTDAGERQVLNILSRNPAVVRRIMSGRG